MRFGFGFLARLVRLLPSPARPPATWSDTLTWNDNATWSDAA